MENKETYNMPSIEQNGHHWIRLVDHIELITRAKKEEREKVLEELSSAPIAETKVDDNEQLWVRLDSNYMKNGIKGHIRLLDVPDNLLKELQ